MRRYAAALDSLEVESASAGTVLGLQLTHQQASKHMY